jgi:hypothetical protein
VNLREFCAIEGYGTAVLTTYQFDPLFFERVVLKDLLASGVRRVVVLADGRQSDGPLEAARGQLVELGRRYRLFQVRQAGAFHAKLCVKLAAEGAAVACGSTNLTYPGWLGLRSLDADVGNREASGAWRVAGGTAQAADLSLGLRRILDRLPAPSRAEVEQGAVADWLATPADEPAGRLLVSGSGDPIAGQLAARWRGRTFSRMWMATGSTDEGGAMLAWAASEFGVASAVVETDPATAAFRPELLERLPLEVSVRARPPRPRPHLKVAVFEGDGGLAAVYGSANCSAAAWLLGPERGGNTEAVVVLDSVERDALAGLVDLGLDGLSRPRGIGFGSLPEREGEPAGTPPRLVLACLTRSTRMLQVAFDRPLATGSTVRLIVGAETVEATPWRDGRWMSRLGSPADGSRTGFVTAAVEGPEPSRSVCWLEDAESLEALERRALDLSSVASLGGGGEDPGRTMKNISKVAQWLLGDWTRDDERMAGGTGAAEPTEPVHADAAPVTPEQIFRSVEEFRARGSPLLAQLSGGGISLAGIMRLVFGDGRAEDERATDALSDELRDGEASESEEDREAPADQEEGGTDPEDRNSDAGDRARLVNQVSRFVDGLADETFEERCTARQLQQAVAFPLACYLLAAKGGWILSEQDHLGWREIVRRVCELTLTERGSARRSSGTLVESVRRRYAHQNRGAEFDAVVGDGTLWVLMLAVATRASATGDPFERDLLLSDVLDCGVLRSRRSADQLAALCAVAQVQDRSGEWLAEASGARVRTTELLAALSPLGGRLPSQQPGRCREGDWLWNPSVGFARITSIAETGTASVHIRSKASTRPNVRLGFYVNLRLSGIGSSATERPGPAALAPATARGPQKLSDGGEP